MKFAPSKLFHAVVISGAALTGCVGTAQKPAAPKDTNAATSATKPAPAAQAAPCPAGSERPFPPCYWIK